MRKNTQTVLTAWNRNRAAGKAGNSIWTDGERIFSYQTCLVDRVDGHTVLNLTKYGPTTSQHQNTLAAHVSHFHTLRNVPRGTKHLAPVEA